MTVPGYPAGPDWLGSSFGQVTSYQSAMTAGARSPIDARNCSSSVPRTRDRTAAGSVGDGFAVGGRGVSY